MLKLYLWLDQRQEDNTIKDITFLGFCLLLLVIEFFFIRVFFAKLPDISIPRPSLLSVDLSTNYCFHTWHWCLQLFYSFEINNWLEFNVLSWLIKQLNDRMLFIDPLQNYFMLPLITICVIFDFFLLSREAT